MEIGPADQCVAWPPAEELISHASWLSDSSNRNHSPTRALTLLRSAQIEDIHNYWQYEDKISHITTCLQKRQRIYQPLDPQKRSIRLLSIEYDSANENRPLCTLTTIPDILEAPPYVALSYEWGPQEANPQPTIQLNNETLAIGPNLHAFLSQYRSIPSTWQTKRRDIVHRANYHFQDVKPYANREDLSNQPTKWKYLWIDALCIDQFSEAEKNHQVSMMGEIYDRAGLVLTWLGPVATNVAKRAFDTIEKHGVWLEVLDHHAVWLFFLNSYWFRLWVVQEVLLARNVILCWGTEVSDWRTFTKWIGKYGSKPWFSFMERKGPVHELVRLRAKMEEGLEKGRLVWFKLPFLVRYFLPSRCNDRRDKVFGLLSLTNSFMEVDYGLSDVEVFRGVLRSEAGLYVDFVLRCAQGYAAWSQFRTSLARSLGIDSRDAISMSWEIWPREKLYFDELGVELDERDQEKREAQLDRELELDMAVCESAKGESFGTEPDETAWLAAQMVILRYTIGEMKESYPAESVGLVQELRDIGNLLWEG